jgi:hypothetical protein
MRIAMWSGPRNLSTAMMYAFGNREDFASWDEPFYAAYLKQTGFDHPMATEIVAAHESDPSKVAARCAGSIPNEKPHFYMKHMPHHMISGMPMDWATECENVHLIRHPARVIASYAAKREQVTAADLGFKQQADLFDEIGGIVIDSSDIRADPEEMLNLLCDGIGRDFDPAMLAWDAGPRDADGVWAKHWYGAVHQSAGFAGAEGPLPELTGRDAELLEEVLPYFERLEKEKI